MKGIKKHLVTLLSAVLMMTSLGIAPALADEAPLGNDDFNIVVNKKLNPKDLTLDLKIKLEDKNPTTPKVVSDLSQVFKDGGKENEKLDLVKDKTDEYEMVVSENGEVEFELNYSKEVKAAEGEAEAINRDEKHNFKVNVTEIEEAKAEEPKEEPKAEEPKVEEPKAEEPKVQEPTADEDVVDAPKASADGITRAGQVGLVVNTNLNSDLNISLPTSSKYDLNFETKLNTATLVYEPKLVIDYSSTKLKIDKADFNYGPAVKTVKHNKDAKTITIEYNEPYSGVATFDFSFTPLLTAKSGDVYNINATFSGYADSLKTTPYEDAVKSTADIKITGLDNDVVAADPTSVSEWTPNLVFAYDQIAGTSVFNRAHEAIKKPAGGKNLYFENLIIKRKPNDIQYSLSPNGSGYIRSNSKQLLGEIKSQNPLEFVMEFGEQNLDEFIYYENTKVDKTSPMGIHDTEYEVYDGDKYVFTYKRSINVISRTSVQFWQGLSKNTVGIGDSFIYRMQTPLSSGPNGVKDLELNIEIPNGLKLNSVHKGVGTYITKLEYELSNSGTFIEAPSGGAYKQTYDLSSLNNVTKIRLSSDVEIALVGNWSVIGLNFENISLGDGQTTQVKPSSGSYVDTDGIKRNLFPYGVSPLTVTGQNASVEVGPASVSSTVITTNLPFPTAPVTNLRTVQEIRLGTEGKSKIENPYFYVIVPKGVTVTPFANGVVSGNVMNADINNLLDAKYLIDQTNVNSVHSLKSAELNDKEIIYYSSEIPNEYLLGHGPSYAGLLDAEVLLNSVNLEAGTYDIKFGVGARDTSDFVDNKLNGGMKRTSLDTKVKNIIGSKNSVAYESTKKFEIKRTEDVQALSWSKGELDSDYILTGNGISTTMVNKTVDYKYEITNTSTTSFDKFEVIEVLPHIGDSYIINSGARNSQYGINYSGAPITATINGATSNIKVQYALTYNPDRFDSNANDVVGDARWVDTMPADKAEIKSIRLLLDGSSFNPGDKLQLQFQGILPYGTPRNDELANNTIAIRGGYDNNGTRVNKAYELPVTSVKATKPLKDGEVQGLIYFDFDGNGKLNGSETGLNQVKIDLFDKADLTTPIESTTTTTSSPATGSKVGMFAFAALDYKTYKIRVTLPENGTAVTIGDNKLVADPTEPTKYAWLTKGGSDEFVVSDISGIGEKSITDIHGGVSLVSNIEGKVQFVDKNLADAADKYGNNWSVELLDGSTSYGTAATDSNGNFKIENAKVPTGNSYTLKFTNNSGKSFVVASNNAVQDGTISLNINPGDNVNTGATFYITDTDKPVITGPTADKAVQPTDITYTVKEDTTDATEAWTIKNASGATVASGTKQADVKAAIAAIATAGEYTFEIVATDAAKNEAKGSTTFKYIPKTAGNEPTLNITGTDTTVELGSALPNLKTAFGVTATDKLGTTIAATNITTTEIDAIPVDGSGNVTTEGTYKVKLEVTDPASGLKANKEVTVTVVDTTAPVLTVTPTTINLNLKKGEANALTFDEFVAKHLTMTMVEAGSQTGIKLQSDDYSVDFATNGTNTFKVYVVDNAAAKNKSNEVTITVEVAVYDDINTSNKEAINAHDFNIKLSDVNDANIKTAAEVAAFDIDQNPAVSKPVTIVTPLPTTVGDHKVKFETAKGTSIEVTAHVFDDIDPVTKEAINAHDFNIKLSDVNDANLIAGAEAAAFDVTTNTPSPVGIATVTHAIIGVGDYTVKFETAAGTSKEVTAHVFDDIDPVTKEAINAHDFNIKLSDVNDANLIAGAEAAAFDVTTNTPVSVAIATVTHAITGVGDFTVKFETAAGTSKEVTAHVFNDIDPVTKEAINAHDFNIKLSDVNDANLIAGAEAAAFDVTTNTPVSVAIATVTHAITGVGDYTVKFETAQGTSIEVTAHVYDEIDPANNEAINAKDFVIQLAYVNEANVKQLSGLKAFDLNVDPAVQLNNDDIKVSALPTTTGAHNITFTTAKGSSITVKAHVFDIVDNVNKIAINANDFSMLIDDVSEAQFITNSGVEAFDVSDVNNITAISDIKVISQLPTTIGKHEVKFEATNAAGKTANIKVEASLFDHGTITPGQGSIYANNFDMKMKNMNNASVIAASGVSAFDANGNAVDVKDIKLVSALPTTAGFHNFIFEANGVQVTVLGHVTARYQVVGHDLNMTMAEFKAFKANGTIEKEIIKRAEGKVINLDTGEVAELASVDYHTADITKLAPGKYDVVLNYTIDGDFIDEETPSTFGLNKTISKHVNLNITDDSNSGNGSGNGNGTGNATGNGSGNGSNTGSNNGSLPSTGMAVDATPILIGGGIIVLGLFLFLLNKKDKEEEQK